LAQKKARTANVTAPALPLWRNACLWLAWTWKQRGTMRPVRALLEPQGTPIGANDTWIAAQALAIGATLVTNNTREFTRVPDLMLENWLDRD
jgi:predicted nucleic acid-binding protein